MKSLALTCKALDDVLVKAFNLAQLPFKFLLVVTEFFEDLAAAFIPIPEFMGDHVTDLGQGVGDAVLVFPDGLAEFFQPFVVLGVAFPVDGQFGITLGDRTLQALERIGEFVDPSEFALIVLGEEPDLVLVDLVTLGG